MKEFQGFMKGVNFGGYLSQCEAYTKEHYDSFITEEDFARVAEMGFDHIRLPIDYEVIMDEDHKFTENGFSYIDFTIENCKKNGLNMVLDLHRTPGFSFDPFHNEKGLFEDKELQMYFYDIWDELAKRYAKHSDMLAFELLNEVTDPFYMDTWNNMAERCVAMIRRYSGDIKILIGGYNNNSVEAVEAIAPPYDDNIVYNFHFYEPLVFTHQGAPWIATMDTEFRCPFEMTYADYERYSSKYLSQAYSDFTKYDMNSKIDRKYFEDLIRSAVEVADKRNVALYCGEYGVIDRADKAEADKWFKLFDAAMDKYKIGHAVWNYRRMDFGLVD